MSWAVWITGLPGSGKSTIARVAVEAIAATGEPVQLLELDDMRHLVTPHPTYSDAERDLVYRALVYVASTLIDAGVPVVIDATAHRRTWRDLARAVVPRFAEVQVTCPLDVCRERERTRASGNAPRSVYAAAGKPGAHVPGVDVAYEPATSPEMSIDTTQETPAAAGARIAALVGGWPRVPRRAAPAEWTVWITGLPGSGKTTIASHVAEALTERGVSVRILDLTAVRAFVTGGPWSALADDVAYRAIVYAAKRLNEAGIAVIIDATAPARSYRDLARRLVRRFAEVQLVCPADVCVTGERAVRWRLFGCPERSLAAAPTYGPDIALAYEHALCPELTIHTDVEDPWSAAENVFRLTLRLHEADRARVA
jgi:adenylylsulfate kinase